MIYIYVSVYIAITIKIIIWINNFNYYVSNYIRNSHYCSQTTQETIRKILLVYCIPFYAHKCPIYSRKFSCIQRASLHEHSLFLLQKSIMTTNVSWMAYFDSKFSKPLVRAWQEKSEVLSSHVSSIRQATNWNLDL